MKGENKCGGQQSRGILALYGMVCVYVHSDCVYVLFLQLKIKYHITYNPQSQITNTDCSLLRKPSK